LLRIAFDACHAGRKLLDLPFYFDSGGELVSADVPQFEDVKKTASIICVSACRDDEQAHTVEKKDDKSHLGGLLWFLLHYLKHHGGSCSARDIQSLSPWLSSPNNWTQTPEVSMSCYDRDATFWM